MTRAGQAAGEIDRRQLRLARFIADQPKEEDDLGWSEHLADAGGDALSVETESGVDLAGRAVGYILHGNAENSKATIGITLTEGISHRGTSPAYPESVLDTHHNFVTTSIIEHRDVEGGDNPWVPDCGADPLGRENLAGVVAIAQHLPETEQAHRAAPFLHQTGVEPRADLVIGDPWSDIT